MSPPRMAKHELAVRVTDSGLGDTYHPGDVATGYIVVANEGDMIIHNITIIVTIFPARLFGLPAGHKMDVFKVSLHPGESTRLEYSQAIPSSVMGISTRGRYRLEANIEADGSHVTTIRKHVNVV